MCVRILMHMYSVFVHMRAHLCVYACSVQMYSAFACIEDAARTIHCKVNSHMYVSVTPYMCVSVCVCVCMKSASAYAKMCMHNS